MRRPRWNMNHSSLRQSPGGSTALWCHCSSRWVLVNEPSFSVWAAAGRKKISVWASSRRRWAESTPGPAFPDLPRHTHLQCADDEPLEVGHREPVELGVRRADRGVLAHHEEAL